MKLNEYLDLVEKRRAAVMGDNFCVQLKIRLDGELISLRFQRREPADIVSRYLSGLVTDDGGEPTSTIDYWHDECENHLPDFSDGSLGIWNFHGEDGRASLTIGHSLLTADYRTDHYGVCRFEDGEKNDFLYVHLLVQVFMLWQRKRGRTIVHGAAVGCDGTGALIFARGGKGKSTLSVSCLLGGFDFVADDYTVLHREDDDLLATPLYRTVGLNPDMYGKLNPELPVAYVDASRDGKLLLDASSRRYADKIRIRAMIVPKVDPGKKPSLKAVDPARAIVPMIHSTVTQMSMSHEQELVRDLMALIAGLPAYEFTLGSDVFENREYLREMMPVICGQKEK